MVKNAHFANAWPETATQKTLLDILPDIPTYPGMTGHVLNAHALRQFQHIPHNLASFVVGAYVLVTPYAKSVV